MRDRAEGSVMRGPGSTIRANEWNAERGNTQTSPPAPIGARGAANVTTSPVSLINLIEAASQSVAPSCDGPRIILAGERKGRMRSLGMSDLQKLAKGKGDKT